ncbi:MAG: hypothetical protein JST40_01885 [Armatimonadetes bacterium]|nr:hypothetical protein [Armatimonadota bacterium]
MGFEAIVGACALSAATLIEVVMQRRTPIKVWQIIPAALLGGGLSLVSQIVVDLVFGLFNHFLGAAAGSYSSLIVWPITRSLGALSIVGVLCRKEWPTLNEVTYLVPKIVGLDVLLGMTWWIPLVVYSLFLMPQTPNLPEEVMRWARWSNILENFISTTALLLLLANLSAMRYENSKLHRESGFGGR